MAIPASNLVSITPRVLAGSGEGLNFNGLFLSSNANLPANSLMPFYSASEVGEFFGQSSAEYIAAQVYFNGFDNSDVKPSMCYFFKHSTEPAPAFVRSAPFGTTQAQVLAAIAQINNGTFTTTINGNARSITSLDFTGVTSLSAAASILQTAIRAVEIPDVAASNSYGTAVTPGAAGNNLSIVISEGTPEVTAAAKAASSEIGTAVTAGATGNSLTVEVTEDTETVTPAKAATCKYGTAKTAGAAGNSLKVTLASNTSTPANFDLTINNGSSDVFTQQDIAGTTSSALPENDYIEWASDVALAVETVQLEGGADLTSKTVYDVVTKLNGTEKDRQENLDTPAELTDNALVTFNKELDAFTATTYNFTGGADAVLADTFDVQTTQNGSAVDTQEGLQNASELTDNAYITFNRASSLAPGIYPLQGGRDMGGDAWAGAIVNYASNLNAFTITTGLSGESVSIANCLGDVAQAFYLTAAQGATYSEGAAPATYTETMNAAALCGQNWFSFTTMTKTTTAEAIELAQWSNGRYNEGTQFLYVMWDDSTAMLSTLTQGDTAAGQLMELNVNGTAGIYNDVRYAAFLMGSIASIAWDRANSTLTLAFKSQSGLGANVQDESAAQALENIRMNFVGNYASRNDNFILLQHGAMFGQWSWIDSYANSTWLSNELQVQILAGLQAAKRVPYNSVGYALIRSWCTSVLERALTNGVISVNVNLSQAQKTQLQQEAGLDISNELYANGYYLQISDADATVRQARESPNISLWYTDAGAVHRIVMPVTTVQ